MPDDRVFEAYESGGFRPYVAGGTSTSKPKPAPRPALVLHPARLPDPAKIKPRQWLYGTQLIRGYVTVLVAPGGTGKSAYAMGMVLGLVANKELLGDHIFAQVNGAVFNLEDPMEELERRLAALMLRHKVGRNEVDGRFFLDDGEGRGLTLAALDEDGFTVVHPDEDALVNEIKANNIGIVVCDPFAESHTLEENSNPQMVKAAAAWRRVARRTECAVLLVHHVRKGDATGIDAARGAKALTDSARVGLLLSTMTEADGETFNISPDDRWQYVRLDDAKRNMAPAAKAKWFKLDQVELGNTDDPVYPNGDRVAAIVAWEPPTVWQEMGVDQTNEVLTKIDDGLGGGVLYSASRRGRDNTRWAGRVLVDLLDISEKQAIQVIATWIKNGVLFEEEFRDPRNRHPRTGLRVNNAKRPG